MDTDIAAAIIGATSGGVTTLIVGGLAWLIGSRGNRNVARESALASFRWAIENAGSTETSQRAAAWVILQRLALDPSLTEADRRMMEAVVNRIRALGGGPP